MKKEYVLKIKNKKGEDFFLDFDSRNGGSPVWSLEIGKKRLSDDENIKKYIESIKRCFKNKKGSFFNQDLNISSLRLCEIGIVKELKI